MYVSMYHPFLMLLANAMRRILNLCSSPTLIPVISEKTSKLLKAVRDIFPSANLFFWSCSFINSSNFRFISSRANLILACFSSPTAGCSRTPALILAPTFWKWLKALMVKCKIERQSSLNTSSLMGVNFRRPSFTCFGKMWQNGHLCWFGLSCHPFVF